jgi:hypothetical protein
MDEGQVRVQLLANKALVAIAGTVASSWEKFTGWLVAGLGASLALIIANLDKLKDVLSVASVSQATRIFFVILVLHAVQKILAVAVAGAVASDEKAVLAKPDPPLEDSEALAIINHIEKSYFFPFSLMIRRTLRRMRNGDLVHVGQLVVRLALASTLFAVGQLLLALWAVWVISRGLT